MLLSNSESLTRERRGKTRNVKDVGAVMSAFQGMMLLYFYACIWGYIASMLSSKRAKELQWGNAAGDDGITDPVAMSFQADVLLVLSVVCTGAGIAATFVFAP